MKRIFYDNLENLVNELKKYGIDNVKIDNENKMLILNNKSIKYNEIDVGFRSFSVPFFIENEIELDYDEKNEDINSILEHICTAYTDKEINAIIDAMPVLKDYSMNRKNALKDVAIIWRDHFLEENVGLLTAFVRMGVEAKDILAIDKGDSTKHQKEITETFKKLGFQVDILDNTAVADDILLEHGRILVNDFIAKRKDKKIVILDDGAIVSRIITQHNYDNLKAFVELTVTGLKRIKKLNVKELPYPVLNVAKSKLKRFVTYKEISNTIFTRTLELLGGEKIVGRTIVQLGYGDLGETLADRYRDYGARVVIIEPDVLKCIQAAEKGYTTFRTFEEAIKYETPF